MEVVLTDKAKADVAFWKKSGDKLIQSKISRLIDSILDTPYEGLGKPNHYDMNYRDVGREGSTKSTGWCMRYSING